MSDSDDSDDENIQIYKNDTADIQLNKIQKIKYNKYGHLCEDLNFVFDNIINKPNDTISHPAYDSFLKWLTKGKTRSILKKNT